MDIFLFQCGNSTPPLTLLPAQFISPPRTPTLLNFHLYATPHHFNIPPIFFSNNYQVSAIHSPAQHEVNVIQNALICFIVLLFNLRKLYSLYNLSHYNLIPYRQQFPFIIKLQYLHRFQIQFCTPFPSLFSTTIPLRTTFNNILHIIFYTIPHNILDTIHTPVYTIPHTNQYTIPTPCSLLFPTLFPSTARLRCFCGGKSCHRASDVKHQRKLLVLQQPAFGPEKNMSGPHRQWQYSSPVEDRSEDKLAYCFIHTFVILKMTTVCITIFRLSIGIEPQSFNVSLVLKKYRLFIQTNTIPFRSIFTEINA